MTEPSTGPLVIVAGCSDYRLDPWFEAVSKTVESLDGRVFRVRIPGGASLFAISSRFGFILQAIFRKGVKFVVLHNHHDCAWIAEVQHQHRLTRRLVRLFRFTDARKLHEWLLNRASRNMTRFACRHGWSTDESPVVVVSHLGQPDNSDVGSEILGALGELR